MIRYDRCILSVTDNVRSADICLRITEYVIQPLFILCCFAASICFTPPINHLWYIFTLILVPNETSSCFLITLFMQPFALIIVRFCMIFNVFSFIKCNSTFSTIWSYLFCAIPLYANAYVCIVFPQFNCNIDLFAVKYKKNPKATKI